ncbi:MAG: addiction module protein [Planctomycetia bacterium]
MATQPLIEQAMTLPLSERVRLAEALWQSIGEELAGGDEREAVEMAARRAAELDSGAVAGRSHEEVLRSIRRAIGCD